MSVDEVEREFATCGDHHPTTRDVQLSQGHGVVQSGGRDCRLCTRDVPRRADARGIDLLDHQIRIALRRCQVGVGTLQVDSPGDGNVPWVNPRVQLRLGSHVGHNVVADRRVVQRHHLGQAQSDITSIPHHASTITIVDLTFEVVVFGASTQDEDDKGSE